MLRSNQPLFLLNLGSATNQQYPPTKFWVLRRRRKSFFKKMILINVLLFFQIQIQMNQKQQKSPRHHTNTFTRGRDQKPRVSKSTDKGLVSHVPVPQRTRSEQKGTFQLAERPREQINPSDTLKFLANNYCLKNFKLHQTLSQTQTRNMVQSRLRPLNQTRGVSVTLDLERRLKPSVQKNNQSVDLHHNRKAEELHHLLKNQTKKNQKLWQTYLNVKKAPGYPKQQSLSHVEQMRSREMKVLKQQNSFQQRSYQSLTMQDSERELPLTITYRARTKQGVLASNPQKVNQDSVICSNNLARSIHLFGVCDGHGQFGHHVSQFVTQHLPSVLLTDPQLGISIRTALIKSIQIVATQVNRNQFDTQFSGTTLNCVVINNGKVICANVGDSRAVIGRQIGHRYKPIQLSVDHKPNIPQEQKRIQQAGGRVDTYYDTEGIKMFFIILGNPIGPSRVWVGNTNYPGLAMSRSLGDQVAASVGVIDKPEIFEYTLVQDDKFMIIASDGVWEFLESKDVVSLVGSHYEKNIDNACDDLMRASRAMWTREDDSVIDDISFVVVFFHRDGTY